MEKFLKNKRILVTGACGTIGRELINQLISNYQTNEIIGIDNNESDLFFLEQEFSDSTNVFFLLTDIRDKDKIKRITKGIDFIFHTAAFKHVIQCERSPFEAVQTNIIGLQNIIESAKENDVEKVIFTSSDKAANPTNVMGTSKLMGERLITAANSKQRILNTVFASTRFGNVLGSRGSVICIFRDQIKKGGPLTLTDPQMTRFIMTINDAVQLIIDSARIARGGGVFVTKMPSIRIQDLAEVMIDTLAPQYGYRPQEINIEIIGTIPGEKLYEELMTGPESQRAWELSMYFVILPAFKNLYRSISYDYPDIISKKVNKPYSSANVKPMTKKQLKEILIKNRLLE